MKKSHNIIAIMASVSVCMFTAIVTAQIPVSSNTIPTPKSAEINSNIYSNNIETALASGNTNQVTKTADSYINNETIASSQTGASTNNSIKYIAIKSIKLDKKQIRLNKGDKRKLTSTIKYKKINKNKKYTYKNEPFIWKSSNKKIATVTRNGTVKGRSKGTTYITVQSKSGKKSAICKVIVASTKYIAVTFDDGPGIYTNGLLDTLDKYNSQATFFVLGNRVNNEASVLKRAYNLGMEIGSHTYSHQNLNAISKNQIIQEISKTKKVIKKITRHNPTVLRPPYGNYNKTVSSNAGVPMIYWSVDTLDWKYRNSTYVKNTIIDNAKDGDIILLHDIHQTSVEGFKLALPKLKKKGYELVTVTELYKIKGKKLKKGVMYFGPYYD